MARPRIIQLSLDNVMQALSVDGVEVPTRSSCRKVLGKKPPCGRNIEQIARHVMCSAFYRSTHLSGDKLLIEHFRKNVKEAWNKYRTECKMKRRR